MTDESPELTLRRLVRESDESRRRAEIQRARFKALDDAMTAALNIYVAQVAAPWRALVWELRRIECTAHHSPGSPNE